MTAAEPTPNAIPQALEAEQAVLGAVLADNAAMGRCEALEPHHFYEPFHGRLWKLMSDLIAAGTLAAPEVLFPKLENDPAFGELGGGIYIADLMDRAPPAYNAGDFAKPIIETALQRELIRIGDVMRGEAMAGEMTAKEQLERAEAELFALAEKNGDGQGFVEFGDALDGALDMAAKAYERSGGLAGLSTGLIDLDRKLGGLHPSDLLILAGRPSMGKSALAANIAFHVARHYAFEVLPDGQKRTTSGGRVAFFSLEMSAEQLSMRLLAEVSGVSSDRIRKGEIDASEFGKLRDARDEIRASPLKIDATGGLPLHRLSARARRLKRREGLDLIIVDYLQLVTTAGNKNNRVQEVSEITQALKALAKDLNVPVIALSQLSRQVESRDDKRPQLADLRESGSIEQDADVVMFVYREAYYLGRAEPKQGSPEHLQWAEDLSNCQGLAEVIIGKQRHGPIGTVRLAFDENITKFGNLAREGRFDDASRLPYGDR